MFFRKGFKVFGVGVKKSHSEVLVACIAGIMNCPSIEDSSTFNKGKKRLGIL
jgi:hypothetical protein